MGKGGWLGCGWRGAGGPATDAAALPDRHLLPRFPPAHPRERRQAPEMTTNISSGVSPTPLLSTNWAAPTKKLGIAAIASRLAL